MKRLMPALAVLLLLTPAAVAQSYSTEQLTKVEVVEVTVRDNVDEGCLPQPNALKVEAELILRGAGIKVVESGGFDFRIGAILRIRAVAFEVGSASCTARLDVDSWRFDELTDGTGVRIFTSEHGGLYTGSKEGFQQQLREAVNEMVTALANEILKARGR